MPRGFLPNIFPTHTQNSSSPPKLFWRKSHKIRMENSNVLTMCFQEFTRLPILRSNSTHNTDEENFLTNYKNVKIGNVAVSVFIKYIYDLSVDLVFGHSK